MLAQLSWSSSTTHTYVLTAIRPASPRHNHTDVHACKQGSRSQIGGCVVVGFAQVSMRDKGVLVRTGVAPPGLKVGGAGVSDTATEVMQHILVQAKEV